ncbi:cell division ATP-binding protein FtsE [Candidatus Saccharibacteria bacterium]|nr:cell division ATP-binding protein FtsE [Candidatus Saccharibacteria bacterium]
MILFDHVTKRYGKGTRAVLDDISLHISANEFVFLVGKSGAGKSTLLKMITKEATPDSGKIIIGGIDLDYVKRRHIPDYRRRIGVVFQDYKLLPSRTVFENVAFALEIAGMSNHEIENTVPKVLDLVGLSDKANRFPADLSGGERQRVSIARSVARQPKILIADEPTGNLDVLTSKEIIDLLQKINNYGTTILVTTHDANIVNLLKKRVITMRDGKIISDQKEHGIYRLDTDNDGISDLPQPGHMRPTSYLYKTAEAELRRETTPSYEPNRREATPRRETEPRREAEFRHETESRRETTPRRETELYRDSQRSQLRVPHENSDSIVSSRPPESNPTKRSRNHRLIQ